MNRPYKYYLNALKIYGNMSPMTINIDMTMAATLYFRFGSLFIQYPPKP